jgi:hypothetical protein
VNDTRTFLSRVYDVKYRFTRYHGFQATELFLGPKELQELKKYVFELGSGRFLIRDREIHSIKNERILAGMKIIGLASDGIMAGISVE